MACLFCTDGCRFCTGESWPEWFTPSRHGSATQARRVSQGFHPMGGRIHGDGASRCGNCKHLIRRTGVNRSFLKCAKTDKQTRGPATDVRAKWPGCATHWESE